MTPTVFREGPFRFYFFSREELRIHVHVSGPDGEAKFWIEPVIALADHAGFNKATLKKLQHIVTEHEDEIRKAWKKHFG